MMKDDIVGAICVTSQWETKMCFSKEDVIRSTCNMYSICYTLWLKNTNSTNQTTTLSFVLDNGIVYRVMVFFLHFFV